MTRCAKSAAALTIMLLVVVAATSSSLAQTFGLLYSFSGYTDGAHPEGPLLIANGKLYGTTAAGGSNNWGTVFTLNKKGEEVVIHFFDDRHGMVPISGVIMDSAGNFYGMTAHGGGHGCDGPFGCGVVFKLDADGAYSKLHTFIGGDADGAIPAGGLVMDSSGNLYGDTQYGGLSDLGVVFKLDPSGAFTILHSFTGGADGASPIYGNLIMDSAGNLYGTTSWGGLYDRGTVFKVDQRGNETVLFNFTGGRDGGNPVSGLVRDEQGNLYGTTIVGGYKGCPTSGCGVVFKLDSTGSETVLYRFRGGTDGQAPESTLVRDNQGNLYGTTHFGGDSACFDGRNSGCGTVFRIDASGQETILHRFHPATDGEYPVTGLVMDATGVLYGTADWGPGYGTIYRLRP